eukprot:TRINITY_DN32994_c0_g1_i1.p1 TRINITY_DN32994_c0_g1~~TRINITY_DN32994_c0_g1_i1.p1  ORF type:complete len:903 (+),score=121.79 TRINITY_DN32994_c0_g1_i1:160-2709(+)
MQHSDTDDMVNQRQIHDLFRRAYFSGYSHGNVAHELMPAVQSEIATMRQRAEQSPSLALGVGMARYYFNWYSNGSSKMDFAGVEDAANLMYASIQFSSCNRADLPLESFVQHMCTVRWPYVVMLYSELGREFATQYMTEEAATALEKALVAFDEMKRLPYYATLKHWQNPYDINFNEEWFPRVQPSGPVWDKSRIPLAGFLESNLDLIASELDVVMQRAAFEQVHFESLRAEAEDYAPEENWHAIQLMSGPYDSKTKSAWDTTACRLMPETCKKLASRPELQGCQHLGAAVVRLRPGVRVKPYFGPSPRLMCDIPLRPNPGARMSVGNRTVSWTKGEAVVYDDTYIRQDWHAGVKGDIYLLRIGFCHPCDESQRSAYGTSVACPPSRGGNVDSDLTPSHVLAQFASTALWAATLPELTKCNAGIGEECPPDTQHGGANLLSAMNTWNYALNNLKAAVRFTGIAVDPSLSQAVSQTQRAMHEFLKFPALEHFNPIMAALIQIFDVVRPWLQSQGPVRVPLPASAAAQIGAVQKIPADGSATPATVVVTLSNGVKMPLVGFGTWKLEGTACYNAVLWALQSGVRHIDTAEAYGNEADIGRAIKDSGVPREEVFIASKATSVPLGMAELSYFETIFAGQLESLQTDYLDVYMLHAAGVKGQELEAVWRAMERLVDLGRVRALGVSNFGISEAEELWSFSRIKPVYMQNIFKVYKQGEQIQSGSAVGLVDWARAHGVSLVGYSVINSWPHLLPPLEDPHVLAIAKAHERTASQVLHRWALQSGVAVIPKASSKERIRENMLLFDFELTQAEMAGLSGLATLSESTDVEVLPSWSQDLFGLGPQSGLPGAVSGR